LPAEKCSTFHGTLAVPNFNDVFELQEQARPGGAEMQAAAPVLGDPLLGCAQASAQSAMKRQATPTEQRVSAGPRFLIQLQRHEPVI